MNPAEWFRARTSSGCAAGEHVLVATNANGLGRCIDCGEYFADRFFDQAIRGVTR